MLCGEVCLNLRVSLSQGGILFRGCTTLVEFMYFCIYGNVHFMILKWYENMCVCVRERERESVCVSLCVCVWME